MLGFNRNKEGYQENKPMKTAVLFFRGNEIIYITKITVIAEGSGTDLMVFDVGRFKYCAMKSTAPLLFNNKNTYCVNANDQNTFDPRTLETLSKEYKSTFVDYLLKNPERMVKTKNMTIDEMTGHDISQDVLTALLDEHTWLNLLKGAIKGAGSHWLPVFVSGMGMMLILLFILGVIAPESIHIIIGKGVS